MTGRKHLKRHSESELTDWLVGRLEAKDKYDTIEAHVTYHRNGLDGEMDVIGRAYKGKDVYYEIKSTHSQTAWHTAKRQFKRCEAAMPGKFDYVYVTPTKVRRYRVERP